MDLEKLYADIYNQNRPKILRGEEYVDLTIDDPTDTRMGMIVVIRPSDEIKENISKVIDILKEIEPEQYYYPQQDFHITLFDIIQARQDFHYTDAQKENCIALCRDALQEAEPFSIEMNGLIMSNACILVKGFYDDTMQKIRERFREKTAAHGLVPDERYPTRSSHITIARFRKPLSDRKVLVRMVDELCKLEFGKFEVSSIDLVYHNWFDSKKEVIKTFTL